MFDIRAVILISVTVFSVSTHILAASIEQPSGSSSGAVAVAAAESGGRQSSGTDLVPRTDLDTAATSAKLLNLGSLFGTSPGYGYNYGSGSGYYPSTNYRPYYTSSGGYYPSTSWSGGYYPNYGSTGYGGYNPQYPSTVGGGYYPTTGGGYYPTTGGTNILGGNGGYGGYGGNGGLRQYAGYWDPEYRAHRNRGYGYYADTDRFGFPRRPGGRGGGYGGYGGADYDGFGGGPGGFYGGGRERDYVSAGYRGYD